MNLKIRIKKKCITFPLAVPVPNIDLVLACMALIKFSSSHVFPKQWMKHWKKKTKNKSGIQIKPVTAILNHFLLNVWPLIILALFSWHAEFCLDFKILNLKNSFSAKLILNFVVHNSLPASVYTTQLFLFIHNFFFTNSSFKMFYFSWSTS